MRILQIYQAWSCPDPLDFGPVQELVFSVLDQGFRGDHIDGQQESIQHY